MRISLLPLSGGNLFQEIKKKTAEAVTAGIKVTRLSIGQPAGPAILEARRAASVAVMYDQESMHEYQDNGSPGVENFAQRFVQTHVRTTLSGLSAGTIDYLPIPGIKPMLDVVIKSLGSWTGNGVRYSLVGTMTKPGYPTPAVMCKMIKDVDHFHINLNSRKGFEIDLDNIGWSDSVELGEGDLLMLNYPHNPTGVVATEEYLMTVCKFCEDQGIRLFNDGAYHKLAHTPESVTLTDVAIKFPGLNWAEAFSASKAGNNTGWRIGAIAGSPEFVNDIRTIKGDMDSGFVAPMAAGIIDLFENYPSKIEEVRKVYASRLAGLCQILVDGAGMKLAVTPKAGFFALFFAPKRAFGEKIQNAVEFNNLMIAKTGIVGVPFGEYIRYSVAQTDVLADANKIREAFQSAKVEY